MAKTKYSLLVPVRNEAARIAAVVKGIFDGLREETSAGQGGALPSPSDAEWEVLIGDDASEDGTRQALVELARSHPFELLLPASNLGRGALRNLLAEKARGQALVFLDGDCRPLPGFFRAWSQVRSEGAHSGKVTYEAFPRCGFNRFLSEGSGMGKRKGAETVPPAYFLSSNFLIAKDLFQSIGGFRTDLPGWGGEDVDLGLRLERAGMPLRYWARAEALHPSVTSVKAYLDRLEEFGCRNLPVLVRDYPSLAKQFKLGMARFPFSLVFRNPVLGAACRLAITGLPRYAWPFALYRYALFNAYAKGFARFSGG